MRATGCDPFVARMKSGSAVPWRTAVPAFHAGYGPSRPHGQLGPRRSICRLARSARQIDAEPIAQAGPPARRQPHRARIAVACDPAKLQAATADFRTDPAGDMISPLAPIETWLAED